MTFASLARCGAATVLCALLAGCGTMGDTGPSPFSLSYARPGRVTTPPSSADDPTLFPDDEDSDSGPARVGGTRVQCVPYARAHSDIDLQGWPRYYFYGQRIMGWVLGSFLIAGLSGLTR